MTAAERATAGTGAGTADNGMARRVQPSEVAVVCIGTEVYGIGTIIKLYGEYMPEALFMCREEGVLTEHLRKSGRRVAVAGGELRFVAGNSAGTLARLPRALKAARRDAALIWPMLRDNGIRVFHAPTLPEYLIGACLRKHGIANAWQVNNNTNRSRLFGLGIKLNHLLAWKTADVVMPASQFIANNWVGCGCPMMVIRNAAAPLYARAHQPALPPFRCLVAGRLEESKGHHVAVEAVIAARQAGIEVELDIFGGPLEGNAYARQLLARIAQTGNTHAIRLLGFAKDLRQRHQQYHLGLQCRIDPEPCSLWVCEAQVDGLPLLASATGGTPELIEDGVTGRLYKAGDPEDMSRKLIEMLASPEGLRAMGEAAFRRGQTFLSPKRMIEETLSAYSMIDPRVFK